MNDAPTSQERLFALIVNCCDCLERGMDPMMVSNELRHIVLSCRAEAPRETPAQSARKIERQGDKAPLIARETRGEPTGTDADYGGDGLGIHRSQL